MNDDDSDDSDNGNDDNDNDNDNTILSVILHYVPLKTDVLKFTFSPSPK